MCALRMTDYSGRTPLVADVPRGEFDHFLTMDGPELVTKVHVASGSPTEGSLEHTLSPQAVWMLGEEVQAWLMSRILRAYEALKVMPKGATVTVRVELDTDSMLKPESGTP